MTEINKSPDLSIEASVQPLRVIMGGLYEKPLQELLPEAIGAATLKLSIDKTVKQTFEQKASKRDTPPISIKAWDRDMRKAYSPRQRSNTSKEE